MGMSLALGASGNLIPTGDLDRLVKKDGPQKLGRSGNLRRFGRLVAKALPCVTVVTSSRLLKTQAPPRRRPTRRLEKERVKHPKAGL